MITREYTIWCDNEGCDEWQQESVSTKEKMVKYMCSGKDCWTTVKGRHYCPECSVKLKEIKDAKR